MSVRNSSKNQKRPLLRLQVLIVAITLTAVVVAILLGRQTYRETKELATEQFNQQQLILARSAATGIEAYHRELSEVLSSLAQLPSIQQMTPECLQEMQHTYWGFPPRTSLRLLDSDGVLRFIYPFEGWRGELVGRDYSQESFFQEVRETGRVSVSGLIVNEQGEVRIRVAVPLYLTHKTEAVRVGGESGVIVTPLDTGEPEAGRFQGVLIGSLDLQTIGQDFISPIVSGETGYAWLLNEDGIFLAHHEEGFAGRNAFEVRVERNPDVSYKAVEQIQQRMMAGEEGVGRYVSGRHRGEKGEIETLVAYTPVHIGDSTWSVAVCAPVSEVEEIVQITERSEQYTLSFVVLALTVGGLALFTISYRWSRSLEREVVRRTRELRETSDYLTNLIRYANAPIIVWNPDRQVTIFNQAFEKMSGRTEVEMMGQPLDVLFPEESRADCLQKIGGASRGEYWETVEIPILGRDGEIHIGLWNSANIYGEDGATLLATIAQGQDITERVRSKEERARTEEALRESEARLRIIYESAMDGMFVIDIQGRYVDVNLAGCRMFGYTREEILTSDIGLLLFPGGVTGAFAEGQRDWSASASIQEYRMRRKDGSEMWVEMTIAPFGIGGEQFVLGIKRDVTERVRSEEERARAGEVLRQHAERLRILREIDQAISSTLALPEVLDQLTRALTMALGINRCSIWLLDESGEFLQGRGYGAQPGEPDVDSIRLSRTESMAAHLFETGQPLMVTDVNDPAYANVINTEYTTAFHIRAFLAVPLVLRGQVTGLLVLDDTRTARIFQPEEIELAQSVATRAAIAIENARLFEQVRAGREQLRDLTSYLQTAREEERAYIAREIHDEFGQSLTALKMDLAWLTKRLPAGSPPLVEKAGAMSNLIDSTIQTVRRVATELRPGLLDDLGLAAAIEWQAQELAERTGINCELYLGDEDIVLERDLSTAIFRIFQETLTNVARHAGATEVQVELEERPDELVLIVRDNGKGIAPGQVSDPRSLGLIGMRERARSWGGDVTFQSVPGQGTVITMRVPRPD